MRAGRRPLPLAIVLVALAGAVTALHQLGQIEWLRLDLSDPIGWLDDHTAEEASAALARSAGLAAGWWMIGSTIVYLGARLWGLPGAIRSVEWLALPGMRRLVDRAVAGSLLVSTLVPQAATAAAEPGWAPVSTAAAETVEPGYVPIPAGGEPAAAEAPPEPPRPRPVPTEAPSTVTVEPGDNLWLIAERRLAQVLGHPPQDAETAPYWLKVVEANRHRLRSGDPDLVYPGEVVALPDVTPPGS